MFDPDEAQPAIDAAGYERLQATLATNGPQAAIETLIAELRNAEDFQGLFYALLMKKRVELGVSPFPTGSPSELPVHTHEAYEDAIREAGRHVGKLLLERKDYGKAWAFFRMLGEPEPMREALEAFTPGPDDDVYPNAWPPRRTVRSSDRAVGWARPRRRSGKHRAVLLGAGLR